MVETEIRPVNKLELTRQKALFKLNAYLETSQERALREHQIDVMQSLYDFFAKGGTAGYIGLPTGSGKTYLIAELAQVLGLKAIFLSPTKTILEQTLGVTRKLAPDVEITDYYSDKKSLTGQIINTTYQSLPGLFERGQINPNEIELLICDEAHTALGEQRHKIFGQLPNALMIGLTATPFFRQIEGYKRRGLIDENTRWAKLFTECIHEMSLEEAIERGILVHLGVHLVQTLNIVEDIEIATTGDYNKAELERLLNTEARNFLTVAMIAGLDKIPPHIRLDGNQVAQIERIHQKIKDKVSIAVFGLSIAHIEKLAQMLGENGITAVAVHSNLPENLRKERLNDYENGQVKVILGVDILSLGWDSPRTEVGIYLAPTHSGIVAVQQLGRILRPSPETGKEVAMAIQLVDQFKRRSQVPILIPNIFDPFYVLRGTQTGREQTSSPRDKVTGIETPPVTFEGMNIEFIIEEMRSQELLQDRFRRGSILEISNLIDEMVSNITTESSEIRPSELYRRIAEMLPHRMTGRQEMIQQAVASIDSNIARAGQKVLLFIYLRTILSSVEGYLSDDEDQNNEIVQTAVTAVYQAIPKLTRTIQLSQQISRLAQRSAVSYITSLENMPGNFISEGKQALIKKAVAELISQHPFGLTEAQITILSQEIIEQTGMQKSARISVRRYLKYVNSLIETSQSLQDQQQDQQPDESAYQTILKE